MAGQAHTRDLTQGTEVTVNDFDPNFVASRKEQRLTEKVTFPKGGTEIVKQSIVKRYAMARKLEKCFRGIYLYKFLLLLEGEFLIFTPGFRGNSSDGGLSGCDNHNRHAARRQESRNSPQSHKPGSLPACVSNTTEHHPTLLIPFSVS